MTKDDLAEKNIKDISVAGRIVLKRVMGNASFATLRDASGDIQIYVTKNKKDFLQEYYQCPIAILIDCENIALMIKKLY